MSCVFANLPNEMKGEVIGHLTDNSENYKANVDELNRIFASFRYATPKNVVFYNKLLCDGYVLSQNVWDYFDSDSDESV